MWVGTFPLLVAAVGPWNGDLNRTGVPLSYHEQGKEKGRGEEGKETEGKRGREREA